MDAIQLSVRIPEITFHVQEAIRKYRGDLDTMVAESVHKALSEFNVDSVVSNQIDYELREGIKSAIKRSISRLMWDEQFSKDVEKAMRERLAHLDDEAP